MVNCVGLLLIFAIFLVFPKEIAADLYSCDSSSECREKARKLGGIARYRQTCCRGYWSNTDRTCLQLDSDSCSGRFCSSHRDCNGYMECCVSNICMFRAKKCPCKYNKDCRVSERCCRNHDYLDTESYRCALDKCSGEHYCTGRFGCVGVSFNLNKQCCRSNKCVSCSAPGCDDDDECSVGEHCCRREWGSSICSKSCEGHPCYSNDDCTAPGECCIRNECTTSCIGNECVSDSNCGTAETCTNPVCVHNVSGKPCPKQPAKKCFSINGCFSASDCGIFGTGYYCCKYSQAKGVCSSNCIVKFCNEDSGCGDSTECCDISNSECEKCSNGQFSQFPMWVIGVIIGIVVIVIIGYVCFRLKKRGRDVPPSQPTQPSQTELQLWVLLPQNPNETVVPSAPPLEPHPSTLTSPPPPSYESVFPNR